MFKGLGAWGESKAVDYLAAKGYSIIERNVRTPYGEIDILAKERLDRQRKDGIPESVIVFVEVKTRRTNNYGFPEESVTVEKLKHLLASAEWYLTEHPDFDENWRIDVIAIRVFGKDRKMKILHLKDVVTTESSFPWDE